MDAGTCLEMEDLRILYIHNSKRKRNELLLFSCTKQIHCLSNKIIYLSTRVLEMARIYAELYSKAETPGGILI